MKKSSASTAAAPAKITDSSSTTGKSLLPPEHFTQAENFLNNNVDNIQQAPRPASEPIGKDITSQIERQDFPLTPPGGAKSITGRVIFDHGGPAKGAKLTVQYLSDEGSSRSKIFTTDSSGSFSLNNLLPGNYRLTANYDRMHSSVSRVVISGADAVDLVLNRRIAASIRGQVIDNYDRSIQGAKVRLSPTGKSVISDEQGYFAINADVIGNRHYHIVTEKTGYISIATPITGTTLLTEQAQAMQVVLQDIENTTEVYGLITDNSNTPIANLKVSLYSSEQGQHNTQTTENGEFHFNQIAVADNYRLSVTPRHTYSKLILENLEINDAAYFELIMEPVTEFGTLAGRLINPQGQPLPGISLIANAPGAGQYKRTFTTQSNGEFYLENIPAGKVYIRSKGTPDLLLPDLSLVANQVVDIDIPYDWGDRSLKGVIQDNNGEPLAGAKVTLQWMSRATQQTISRTLRTAYADDQGQFYFNNLGDGEKTLVFSLSGYESIQRVVNISFKPQIQISMGKR